MDVLELILEQARLQPHHSAAKDAARDLSYGELEEEVVKLAAGVSRLGVRSGDRVALHLPNSVDFLVASMACMWLGAVFVPLACADPPIRISSIVDDCDPVLVLTSDSEQPEAALPPGDYGGRPSVRVRAAAAASGIEPPGREGVEDRPAYCIYTSGTTGRPKGVLISHDAFSWAVRAAATGMELQVGTRALCVSPFHFDGSFGTLFSTPVAGGALVIPDRESLLWPQNFFKVVADEEINHTSFSPSYLRLVLSSRRLPELSETSLRTLALGGEACTRADLEALWSAVPGLRVFNRYGPTEATIAVTTFELTPEIVGRGQLVPIGQPHPGVVFRLVDSEGSLVEEPGKVGELYIGGRQLMSGYWGDPDLTAAVMRADFVPGETFYRTGDLMFRDEWGDYVYLDRTDRVVKRRAVRISLAEVTDALRKLPGVSSAVCVPFDHSGELGIAAFIVMTAPLTALAVRRDASEHLPASMIPDVFEVVDSIPMTSASKVDERALLAGAGLLEMR
jgi:amino acid adenylation domain-containing protein